MSIHFACPCGRPLTVPDDQTGRRCRCPGCQAVLTVPAAGDRSEADSPDPTPFGLRPDGPTAPTADGGEQRAAAGRYMRTARRRLREDDDRDDRRRRDWARGFDLDGWLLGGGLVVVVAVVLVVTIATGARRFFWPILLLLLVLGTLYRAWSSQRSR